MSGRLKGPYVRSIALSGFAGLVTHLGGDPNDILMQAGIAPAALTNPDCLISWGAMGAACEFAAQHLGEPDFGFLLGLAQPSVFPSAIPLVLLARDGQTMQDWMLASSTQWRFFTNGYTVNMYPRPDGGVIIRLVFNGHSFAPRQVIALSFVTLVRLWRTLGGHNDTPAAAHFQQSPPRDPARYHALFGDAVAFDQPHCELHFSGSQLNAQFNPPPDTKRALVDWLVRRRIESDAGYDQSMSQTVALVISSILGAGLCNMDFVAASLSHNPKKLQRLLARENTTFSEVLDGVRARLALRLLTTTDVGIAQIAGLLDYAATAPFSLAVRRWYGMSPVALRHHYAQDDLESRRKAAVGGALTAG